MLTSIEKMYPTKFVVTVGFTQIFVVEEIAGPFMATFENISSKAKINPKNNLFIFNSFSPNKVVKGEIKNLWKNARE
jgi:hypothetical protein